MPIYIYRDELTAEEREFLAAELNRLSHLSTSELESLPEHSNLLAPDNLKGFFPSVHRERTDEGELRIIVQGSRDTKRFLFLQFAAIEAGGFLREVSGAIRKLEPDELYDYT